MITRTRFSTAVALILMLVLVVSTGLVTGCGGPPLAQFQSSVSSGQAPFSVTFTNASKNADELTWDFGDGETQSSTMADKTVTHEFKKAGALTVTLTATKKGNPPETNSTTAAIAVAPGVLASISIAPVQTALAPQGKTTFTAEAKDEFGNILPDQKFTFKADAASGQVDSSGAFTAVKKAGAYEAAVTVEAVQGSITKSATAKVTVNPGPLDHVVLNKTTATLNIGNSQDFTAATFDAFENPVSAQITWSADKTAGTVENGKLTAGTQAGTYAKAVTVTATLGSATATATAALTVKPDPLDSITTAAVETAAGAAQQLKADAKDKYGNPLSDVQFSWSIKDDNAGSAASGTLAAGQVAGLYVNVIELKATQGDITKTTNVSETIVPGPLAQVVIGPGSIELGMGMTQQFVAVGADQYGNRISGLTFNWTVEASGGTIDSKGLFTASTTTGTYNKTVKATATQGSVSQSGTANVTVLPDRLAFTSDRDNAKYDLYVMNVDGTGVVRVTKTTSGLMSEGIGGGIAWSPDGRLLAVDNIAAILVTDEKYEWANIITTGKTVDSFAAMDPAWSPDGKKIVYMSVVGTGSSAQVELYSVDIDGGNITRLTNTPGDEWAPAWSPDGTKIVYDYSAPDAGGDIWIMDGDGKNAKQLTSTTANDTFPGWSPDGTTIVFQSNRDGDNEIFVMMTDGSNVKQLTTNSAFDGAPSWSPDGSKIAFSSQRDGGKNEVYLMNADGTGAARLTSNSNSDLSPTWAPRKKGLSINESAVVVPNAKALKPLTVQQITAQSRAAVVRIEVDLGTGLITGSGFIIDPNGLIMTANHVVSSGKPVTVYLDDGTKYTATVKGRDMIRDIAILKITATGLPYLKFGDLSKSGLGQQVVVMGYPLGSKDLSVTSGLLSAIKADNSHNITWIQTDSAINGGNSGGPLLNLQGEVIGVVTQKWVQVGVEGIGLAISSNTIDTYLARLKDGQVFYQ